MSYDDYLQLCSCFFCFFGENTAAYTNLPLLKPRCEKHYGFIINKALISVLHHYQSKMKCILKSEETLSPVNCHNPPRCRFLIKPSFIVTFLLQTGGHKVFFSIAKTICYCGNHFKVVYAISHHSKPE